MAYCDKSVTWQEGYLQGQIDKEVEIYGQLKELHEKMDRGEIGSVHLGQYIKKLGEKEE